MVEGTEAVQLGLATRVADDPKAVALELAREIAGKSPDAVRAAKRMGLNVCGVDMLRSNHGPVIMEVNSSPGLEGIEAASGKDIAGQIIEFIEKSAKIGATKTKGAG